LPYERVENMLTTCCIKLYSMTLDGFEETKAGPRKVIRISFEDPSDRERFRVSFQKTRGLDKADIPMPPTLANPRTN
jgi:hypothetical protein